MLHLQSASPHVIAPELPLSDCPRWYVVETHAAKEALAQQQLQRQSFRSFYPRIRKTRRHARRQDTVLAPLFPGYVFVRFNVEQQPWHCINSTFGVRRLVGSRDARPDPMPESAMEFILSRCKDGIMTQILPTQEIGQAVRVISGPFTNNLAIISQFDAKGRVKILLDILGGNHAVSLHLDCLVPA